MPRCNRVPTVRPGVAFALVVAAWSNGGNTGDCGADASVACSSGYGNADGVGDDGCDGGRRGPGPGSTR
jgi:hypothetical protein